MGMAMHIYTGQPNMRIRKKKNKSKKAVKGDRTTIHLGDDAYEALQMQREAFKAKFGRDPGPNDPVFFDPTADYPKEINSEWMETQITEAMSKASVDEELIYAYEKTGFIVGADTPLTDDETAEWDAAIREYRLLDKTERDTD